jgi:hypothetical protein
MRSGTGYLAQGDVMMADGHQAFALPLLILFGDQDKLTRCDPPTHTVRTGTGQRDGVLTHLYHAQPVTRARVV